MPRPIPQCGLTIHLSSSLLLFAIGWHPIQLYAGATADFVLADKRISLEYSIIMAGLFGAITSPVSGVVDFAAREVEGIAKGVEDIVAPLESNDSSHRRTKRGAAAVGIFQGHDKVTGFGRSSAVTGTTETLGGSSRVKYQICTSIEELCDSLEVDQSLSVSYLSVASMNQKMKFIDKQKVSTYSTSIVVYAKHSMGTESLTDVSLKEGIKAPQSSEEVKAFVKSYGDSFLASRTKGGEYFAVYTFYSESREKQRQLSLEMQAEGVFLSTVDVKASLGVKLNKFRSSQKTRSKFDQSITGIANPELPEADDVISFAVSYPKLELTAPEIIGFETEGYEHVPGMGPYFDPVGKNRDLITGSDVGETNFLAELGRLRQLQNDISLIKDTYKFYGGYNDDQLNSVEIEVKEDANKVKELLRGYVADPVKLITSTPELSSVSKGTPTLTYMIQRSAGFGDSGNNKFDDVDIEKYFSQFTRIKSLSMRYYPDKLVGALRVTYVSDKDEWKLIHGSEDHGGKLETRELQLLPQQFVTVIKGSYGNRPDLSPTASLTQLIIGLSDLRYTATPTEEFGTKFEWIVPKGCFTMGFAGEYGWFLDKLQVIYGSFKPATWDTRGLSRSH